MEVLLYPACFILAVITVILTAKIYLIKKSADEIREQFTEKLTVDTNTLICISSRDKSVRRLAKNVNSQLKILRSERHRFVQGDLELKEAVTNISHDIRTPLTAICGYLDLMEREPQSEQTSKYISIIRDRTEILKQLTEELFRYSVFSSNSEELPLTDLTLNSVLEESLSAHYTSLIGANIEPKVTIPETKIVRQLNKNALSRIFGNIISNAVKYSDGDLEITLKENGEVIFSNTAANLNEVEVGKLFNRFYTVETAQKSTGLGLSIARILTEKMNGTIEAQYIGSKLIIKLFF